MSADLVKSAEFIKSAPSLKDAPDLGGLPELVLVGRSNVGKSSFINSLLGRKNLAQTSNTPGKTRLMNFYKVNDAFVFVDLPGYGYAKVSHTEQASWRKNLENFLTKRELIRLVIQLIDARHGPQENDLQMNHWLRHHQLPVLVVLTKIDKLSKAEVQKMHQATATKLELDKTAILPFSAQTHAGKDTAWAALTKYLADF